MKRFWQIGDFEFCAEAFHGGWVVSGTVGCLDFYEETYSDDPIERIMDESRYWVMKFSRELHESAANFNPSEFL